MHIDNDALSQIIERVQSAIRAIADGKMIVVADDEDRENEGDLIMAGQFVTPERIAFMIRHTSGILCTPVVPDIANALHLSPMVVDNNAPLGTAFTVSVDHRKDLKTGISAQERCNTILALASEDAKADDFVRPGHVFPLIAQTGGVLFRAGHTEASIDLVQLAGLYPVGLLAEIVNDDGTVMRMPDLLNFSKEHDLEFISVADLITYRYAKESMIKRIREFDAQTIIGPARAIVYGSLHDNFEHVVLIFGKIDLDNVLVRIHRQRIFEDIFGSQDSQFSNNLLTESLEYIRSNGGKGILMYLRQAESNLYQQPSGSDQPFSESQRNWKEVGLGAQILRDLGVKGIRLLVGRKVNFVGFRSFGIDLIDTELLNA